MDFYLLSCVNPGPEEVQKVRQRPHRSISYYAAPAVPFRDGRRVMDGGSCNSTSAWTLPILPCAHARGSFLHNAPGSISWRRIQGRCNSVHTIIQLQLQRCPSSLPSRTISSKWPTSLWWKARVVLWSSVGLRLLRKEHKKKHSKPDRLTPTNFVCICDVILWSPFTVWAQNSIYWGKLCLH